jgi:hypothetical protein
MTRMGSFLPAFAFLVFAACTSVSTTPMADPKGIPTAAQGSSAYQYALAGAFSELETRDHARGPASDNDANQQAKNTFTSNFKKTRRFEVLVYPKFLELPNQRRPSQQANIKYDEPAIYQFRIDRQGHCALAGELVPDVNRADCIQIEIRPMSATTPGQFVRVFMNAEYRVFGLSYHEYDAEKNIVKNERKKLRWDPSEPLSSELLSLAKDIVPLDLPIYATNSLKETPERVQISRGSRTGETCDGMSFKYKNSYGSAVKADWCLSDPWPTVVETSRYLAVLQSTEAGGN